ncbi:RbsD/FucU transport protein family [Coniella lustricola]|uniref:L-fucose mutarotase n=1 Tax=Coniella lustricola TaxID=2025994 RepID=A0A2T3A1J3_9PEZI|nr:RbsD/FucU transport protein family [Coniella lustricola]
MLKNINPLLTPELLAALRAMGHGNTIAIVDANFPASSPPSSTNPLLANPPVIRLAGATATQAADAILSVLPLDDFVARDQAARCMAVVGDPEAEVEIMGEFRALVDRHEGGEGRFALGKVERFAFYEEVKRAFVIVVTDERRLYGNLLLMKGVIKG